MGSRSILGTSVAVALLLVAAAAHAETRTLTIAKVKVDPPEGWKVEEKGSVITMVGPNEEVSFILQVADAPNQEAMLKAVQGADAFLSKFATEVKWAGKPQEKVSNGMKTLENHATAKVSGKDARVTLVVYRTPADKILTFIGVLDATKEKTYQPALQKFLESVKPV